MKENLHPDLRFEGPKFSPEEIREANEFLNENSLELPDGMEVVHFDDLDGKKSPMIHSKSEEIQKTFSQNNSRVLFIDENSVYRVAPSSPERMEALEKAGYKDSGGAYHVPFSSGELPSDPSLREKWENLMKEI